MIAIAPPSLPPSRRRLLSPAWPYILVACIALDTLTWWGVGVVTLLHVSVSLLFGIARNEIIGYRARRAARVG